MTLLQLPFFVLNLFTAAVNIVYSLKNRFGQKIYESGLWLPRAYLMRLYSPREQPADGTCKASCLLIDNLWVLIFLPVKSNLFGTYVSSARLDVLLWKCLLLFAWWNWSQHLNAVPMFCFCGSFFKIFNPSAHRKSGDIMFSFYPWVYCVNQFVRPSSKHVIVLQTVCGTSSNLHLWCVGRQNKLSRFRGRRSKVKVKTTYGKNYFELFSRREMMIVPNNLMGVSAILGK